MSIQQPVWVRSHVTPQEMHRPTNMRKQNEAFDETKNLHQLIHTYNL